MDQITRDHSRQPLGKSVVDPMVDGTVPALRQASGPGKRSTLHVWMFDHQTELAQFIAAGNWPGWRAVAKTLADLGLSDARGKPATEASARLTWFYLRRRQQSPGHRNARPAPALVSSPLASAPAGRSSAVIRQASPLPDDDDVPQGRIVPDWEKEFRFATFRS